GTDIVERGGAQSLLIMNDSTVYIGLTWTDNPMYDPAYCDIIKTDTMGEIILQRRLIDDAYPPTSIIKSFDDKILAIGYYHVDSNWDIYLWKMNQDLEDDTLYTQPITYDSLCPYEIQSDTVALDCGLFVNIDELPTQEQYESSIKISPNPASDWVVLTLPDVVAPGAVEVQVYDVFGREAWGQGGVEKMPVNRMVLLDVLGYPAGIYVVVVTDKKGRRYTGKIVK
ncbi:MAG TPA: T9SS type A sorting domain-containing protein, partial [Bacteroidales bacterium]|nr:T9SS type A sorting domain-containing protein [Bacteroidales bacterium]